MPIKVCPICLEEKDYSKFRLNADGSIRGNDCTSCRAKKERAQLKLAFLEAFNSTCTCCGENDPRFLTLDHVNNDGNKHRETLKEHQIMREAKNEGWPRAKYTCLCLNCNLGRSVNGGICPHKCKSKEEYKAELLKCDYRMGKEFVNHNTSNLEAARETLKQKRAILKSFKGFSQDQIAAIIAAVTK
jgi:hypothetical protein